MVLVYVLKPGPAENSLSNAAAHPEAAVTSAVACASSAELPMHLKPLRNWQYTLTACRAGQASAPPAAAAAAAAVGDVVLEQWERLRHCRQ
jgi:hypothetical protein